MRKTHIPKRTAAKPTDADIDAALEEAIDAAIANDPREQERRMRAARDREVFDQYNRLIKLGNRPMPVLMALAKSYGFTNPTSIYSVLRRVEMLTGEERVVNEHCRPGRYI